MKGKYVEGQFKLLLQENAELNGNTIITDPFIQDT